MPSGIWKEFGEAHKADRAKIAAAKVRARQRPAPDLLWKAYLPLSAFGQWAVFLDPSDVDLRTALTQIEQRHCSKIRIDEEQSRLYVDAEDEVNGGATIEATLYVLCDREQHATNVWRPWILVSLPNQVEESAKFSLEEGTGGKGVRAALRAPDEPLAEDRPTTLNATHQDYRRGIEHVFDTVVKGLRINPHKMHMRAHFGTIGLLEWKRNKDSYTLTELKSLFARAGPRGTATFETLIGNVAVVDELRRHLANLTAIVPYDIKVVSFYAIEPAYSIILITKNLNIESEIYQVTGQGILGLGVEETAAYSFGPVQASYREKRNRTVEVMSSCPDGQFDWVFEVQNTVDMPIPFDSETLRQNIAFTGEYWPSEFPAFKIYSHFVKANDLESVIGKKTWRHPINTAFSVEISTYHRWVEGALGPPVGFGLSLSCSEWDVLTRPADIVSGPRPWESFADVFLPENLSKDHLVEGQECSGEDDGCADFLYWVDRVRKILEDVSDEKDLDEDTSEEVVSGQGGADE